MAKSTRAKPAAVPTPAELRETIRAVLAALAKWYDAHPGGLVIVDTLARFRDLHRGRGNSYLEDYGAIAPLKELADRHCGAVLVIHHTRKDVSDDPFDEVSGTLGINGAADSLLVLDRVRGQDAGTLYLTGRDLADETLTLAWQDSGVWSLTGRADGIERMERPQKPKREEECAGWLGTFLGEYAWPDAEVSAAARDKGFSESVLKRAKTLLRKAEPALVSAQREFGGEWWNWLGEKGKPPGDRPDPYVALSKRPVQTGETGETGSTNGKPHVSLASLATQTGGTGQSRHPTESKTPGDHQSRQSRQSGRPAWSAPGADTGDDDAGYV